MRDFFLCVFFDGIIECNKCDKIFEFFNGMYNIDLNCIECFFNVSY